MKWAAALTTVPERRGELLPRTLASLANAGFGMPRIFLDGGNHALAESYERQFGAAVTARYPKIRTYGNWILALAETYIREPTADRFLVTQDDAVWSRNVRQYLERVPYPDSGYLNLYTFPQNQAICPREPGGQERTGFFLSNQNGKGAVALVFDRRTVLLLLTHQPGIPKSLDCVKVMAERPLSAHRGHRSVDGGVVTALKQVGVKEYCHHPSLVQHIGLVSSMGNKRHPEAPSFRGEDFDCLSLLGG